MAIVTTRDRLIDASIDLFYRHGFHAVGIDRIIAEVGVTKTTFYNHFESKEELVIEAIRRRDAWEFEEWMNDIEALAGDDPREKLLAAFDVLDRWFNDEAYQGCLFLNAAVEFPSPHDPAHQAAAEHKQRVFRVIRDLARQVGLARPDDFTHQDLIIVEGAMVKRQVSFDNTSAKAAKCIAEMLLREHEAASRQPPHAPLETLIPATARKARPMNRVAAE